MTSNPNPYDPCHPDAIACSSIAIANDKLSFGATVIRLLARLAGRLLGVGSDLYSVAVNVAAGTTNALIVDPRTDYVFVVHSVFALAAGASTPITFNSRLVGTPDVITNVVPVITLGEGAGFVLPYNPDGWFRAGSGEFLTLTTGAGSVVSLIITGRYEYQVAVDAPA